MLFNTKSKIHAVVESALWFDVGAGLCGIEPECVDVPPDIIKRAALIRPVPGPPGLGGPVDLGAFTNDCATQAPSFPTGRDEAIADDGVGILAGVQSTTARRNARRVAFAAAVWDCPDKPVVTPAIVEWSCRLVERGVAEFAGHTKVQENDEGRRTVRAKVLEAVGKTRRHGLLKSRIPTEVRAYRELKLKARGDIIEALVEDGEVVSIAGLRHSTRLYLPGYAPAVNQGDGKSGPTTQLALVRG